MCSYDIDIITVCVSKYKVLYGKNPKNITTIVSNIKYKVKPYYERICFFTTLKLTPKEMKKISNYNSNINEYITPTLAIHPEDNGHISIESGLYSDGSNIWLYSRDRELTIGTPHSYGDLFLNIEGKNSGKNSVMLENKDITDKPISFRIIGYDLNKYYVFNNTPEPMMVNNSNSELYFIDININTIQIEDYFGISDNCPPITLPLYRYKNGVKYNKIFSALTLFDPYFRL